MDEEPDYMSDDFLASCAGNDLRPGLVHNRTKQREIRLEKKKMEKVVEQRKSSSKNAALERLTEGLDQPIGPENKGFAMLQKMGFKPGTSLGTSQTGLTEPIGISLKTDRKGLGREKALQELRARKRAIRENVRSVACDVEAYRAGLSQRYRERDIMSDLLKSQKACYKFDTECNIERPEESWFWPEKFLPADEGAEENEEDEEDDLFSPSEKLEMLTLYLRTSYRYCIWCGVEYDDDKDMTITCPGVTREEH